MHLDRALKLERDWKFGTYVGILGDEQAGTSEDGRGRGALILGLAALP
jgi:hypothetical protein